MNKYFIEFDVVEELISELASDKVISSNDILVDADTQREAVNMAIEFLERDLGTREIVITSVTALDGEACSTPRTRK